MNNCGPCRRALAVWAHRLVHYELVFAVWLLPERHPLGEFDRKLTELLDGNSRQVMGSEWDVHGWAAVRFWGFIAFGVLLTLLGIGALAHGIYHSILDIDHVRRHLGHRPHRAT
jgi:hypothetical protein